MSCQDYFIVFWNHLINFRVHKWSRALEVLGESSRDAEKAAREVRKRVRSVLGDEVAPNLVDDAAVSLVMMFSTEDPSSSGFSHSKHAEVRQLVAQCCPVHTRNGEKVSKSSPGDLSCFAWRLLS